jgi:phage/plasmid-associated DNA primase
MGKFVEPESCRIAKSDYQFDSNPHREFITQNYEYTTEEGWFVPCSRIYDAYKSWCRECGYHPLNHRNFGKEVRAAFSKNATGGNVDRTKHRNAGEREWVYTHLKTLADYSVELAGL